MDECRIVLSIDATPSYGWLARRCIESIRRSGTAIPIVLFVTDGTAVNVSEFHDVDVVMVREASHESIYVENWYRLASVRSRRLLCLDVDTVCLGPLERVFESYQTRDVYARVDLGSRRDGRPQTVGTSHFGPQVDWPLFLAQKADLGVADVPLFNTGVVLLNHGLSSLLGPYLGILRQCFDQWTSGSVAYPCTNRHIVEQLAASVMLGAIPNVRVGVLRRRDAPFFCELSTLDGPGHIVHVWTGRYRSFLSQHASAAELVEYDDFRRRDLLRRIEIGKQSQGGTN